MASKEVLKIAGLKLSVEGAAQFQTSLKSINSQMKLSSAELQKVTAQYGRNSTATGALTTKKKALEDKLKSQRQVTTQLNSVLKETEQRYGENSTEANTMRAKVLESEAAEERLKTQLKAVTLELAKQSSKAVQLGQKLQTVGEKMKGVGTKMKTLGSNMTKFVTVPILAAGAGLFKLAENFEKAERVIRVGTGATGDALKGLQDDFEAVYGSVPSSMEDASVAIADLNTRLGLTGKPLQNMAEQMLNLSRITNVDVSTAIKASTRMFKDAGIAQEDYADALDYTFRVSQSTGIGIDRLQELMTKFGGPLRQMGFDWQEAAAMLGKFEQEGVNTELVVGSLRIALGKMAQEGIKDPPKALAEITKRIKEAGTAGEANAIALETFGARAGPDMAAAIREGRLDFDKLLTSLKNGKDTINGAAKETETFSEKFQLLKNKLALALKPLAGEFMKTLEDLIPTIVDVVKGIGDLIKGFNNLSPETKKLILMAVGLSAALGPVVRVMGSVTSAAGSLTKGVGKIIEKFGASHAAAAAASAGLGSVSSAATGASTAAAGATTATAGLSGSMLGVLAPAGLLVGAAIAIGTAIDNATTTTDEFSREMTNAFENFAADVATANGVMEVFVSDTTASGKAVETVRDKINKVEGQIVSAYKAYMADKGAERDKDLADIREYNAELRELMLDEMSAYGTAQQVLADQLRLGTIEVTKENLADVVKSIGEAETQAKDAADKIYEEQARYVLMNKDLTQEQKDDQLRKLAETRDEGKKIAKQMAADSAYYARLQMQSNDKNLAQRLKTVRNYGSKMTTAEKDFAREYQEISNRKYTDETQRSRDLQALGLRYARSQQENAQLVSDAWLSVDEDTRAAWINLINAEAEGGRTLSTNTRQTVDALMRMYASMPGGLKNVGEDMMVALGRAIINEKSPERAANATKKDCVNAFKNAYGEYEEAGIKSMNKAAVGMKKGKPGVKTEAGKTKDVAVGEFRKLESAAESSGKSGIQGLIRGVRNPTLRNILYWAARALAQKANQGIKDGIQTGSPSKLWEKYGKWGAEGLVEGIKKEGNRVLKAATNLARKASTGVKDGLDLGELVSTYKEKFATIKTQLSDLKKSHADNLKAIKNTYKQTVETIKASREARAQQLGSFGGMFDAGEVKESVSGEQMIANMRKNAKATIEYKNAFESLTKKNLPKEFMDQISELGIENTAQMQTLNSMTSKELAEYVRLWSIQQTNAAKAAKLQYQDEMKAAAAARDKAIEEENEAYEKQVKKLLVKYYDAMSELGKAISDGMTKGISTSQKNAIKAAGSLAKSVGNAIKDALKIASPSKVTMEFGKWTGRGFVDGLIAEEQHVTQAARNLASAANVGVVSGVEKPSVEKPKSAPANIEAMIERGIEKAMSRVTVELDKRQVGRLVVLREV